MNYLICGGKPQMVMTVVVLDSRENKKKAAVIEHTKFDHRHMCGRYPRQSASALAPQNVA